MAFAALVASRIMVKQDQIEGFLGDLPFATIKRRTKERIDHLDQRRGPYNGVEFVEHQRFEGGKLVASQPFGARQPEGSFFLMGTLWLRPRLVDERIMVPRQHEPIAGIVRNHGTAFSRHRFGLLERDDHVIDMLAKRLERVGNGSAVERCDHVEKQRQVRADVFDRAQSALRRA